MRRSMPTPNFVTWTSAQVAEFAVRHPKAARVVNVPFVFFHPTTKDVHPNQSFLLVMNDRFAKDAALVVGGADDDERAANAAAALAADGFTNLTVMTPGYTAWTRYDLPVTADNRDGVNYASLLTAAKRRKS